MTNFETLNNMDINFAEISENELMEMEGGAIWTPLVVWAATNPGSAAAVAGSVAAVGLAIAGYMRK